MTEQFLDYLSKKKNKMFLIMCLMVHALNVLLFFFLGIFPLMILNIFSTVFYIVILFSFKENKDFYIIFTYLEIISFSLISELFTAGSFCYIFYVIGMISAVCYLLPPKKSMKHIFQGIGIFFAIAIFIIRMNGICLFPKYAEIVDAYKYKIGLVNLCITLFTLFYISNLYIYEINEANDKLAYCSDHDLLTGLFNRRFFEHIMHRNKTENENKYTIAIFDIDDFKKINDTYGHQAGDCVLQSLSQTLGEFSDPDYVNVRWGGEEFVLYMPATDEQKAYEHLEKLRKIIEDSTVEYEKLKINITVTIGMSTGSNLINYENVIHDADEKLYAGKRNGKNCVVK